MENTATTNTAGGTSAATTATTSATKGATTAGVDKYGGLRPGYYWFFIIFMVVLSMFGSFVNDMFTPALPELTRFFGCSVSTANLSLSLGMVGLGLGQIIFGPLSDKIGRKPILVLGMGIFLVGGVTSIFSPTIDFFVTCRLVQGIGASTGYFLARTIPADVTHGRPLAKMMALIGAINGIAPASAPVLGGIVSNTMGWRWIFVFLCIFAVLVVLLSLHLKESLPKDRRAPGSLWQAFKGYGSLLKQKNFMIHVMLKGSALGLLFAYISSAPYIMQDHYGFSDIVYGLFIGGNALFVVFGSLTALKFKLLKQSGVLGTWLLVPVMVAQAAALWWLHDFWVYEILNCVMLFCLGMIFTMSNTLAMNEGRTDAGRASAILGVMGYVFGAIVSPAVGLGDVLHSTAIVYLCLVAIVALYALFSARLAPDLNR